MRLGKWEHAHTSIDNLVKEFPKHKRGDIKGLVSNLIKNGFLLVKPTGYGREISLSVEKKKEIEEFIAKYLEEA
jgi:hypothetical protein